ncbi:MAG: tRNA lysidine(34) synthetase TilS [Spirochaetales bacterium]|nr:tRNA lysidine(34) synthetase TilS [Spirochaetales bacterium]
MGSTASRLKEEVRKCYFRWGIPWNTPQIIAFSGGADSVALLYLLKEILSMEGVPVQTLTAAYYNHKFRPSPELEREMENNRRLCREWGVPLVIGEAEKDSLKEQALREKRSLEDTAREARYAFLEEVREEKKASHIVLAHHGDDQSETMISRFFQGSGLAGLGGIHSRQGDRLRPLLSFSKKELIRCLETEGIPWSEDSTNGDESIQRNSLRSGFIQAVAGEFPGYLTSLTNLSEKLHRYHRFLENLGNTQPWRSGEGRMTLDRGVFLSLDPAVREYTLYYAIDRLLAGQRLTGGKGRRLPYRFIRPLLGENPFAGLPLAGHGMRLYEDGRELILEISSGRVAGKSVSLRGESFIE